MPYNKQYYKVKIQNVGTRIYNPLAPIIAKGLPQEFTNQKPQRHLDVGDGSLKGIFRGLIGRSQPRTKKKMQLDSLIEN